MSFLPLRRPGRRTRLAAALLAGSLAVTLAACGSQLDPDTVAKVNGTTNEAGDTGDVGDVGDTGDTGDTGDVGDVGDTGDTGSTGDTGDTGSSDKPGTQNASDSPQKGENSSTGDGPKASCNGFKNQTGITDSKITIANVSDLSGPVPGIFESAQMGTRAYVAYFNSQSSICGRKLEVMALDSRADAGADQKAYLQACDQAFAAVGSMSAFDSGGAGVTQSCGLPDLRSVSVNPERQKCSTCFATQPVGTSKVPDSYGKWFMSKYKDATQHTAVLYINAGAAPVNAKSMAAAWKKIGFKVDYEQGIDVAEFNFAPYVQQMKSKGIKFVMYQGPYQNTVKLQQAMKQQQFKPDVYLQDATIYDKRYVDQAGGDGDGSFVFMSNDLFENRNNKEMQLYLSWLQQVKPGAAPNMYGLYAWSAARLFVEKSLALGGRLDRKTLISAINSVNDWTGNGLHAKQHIGASVGAECTKVIQLKGSTWRQVSPGSYMCGSMVSTGIGG
ncbi:ABC transporter substrate-binding protein [Nocardioides daejeonensis]|uniref:ABC transporter substrate-binding protein n=1 Tax=Nocardioides daejeonensis TaxID=1046556 RepID=UPI000D746C19|nr:ABC transporter substrate-binding protein [Nocardioides daejeonensis]